MEELDKIERHKNKPCLSHQHSESEEDSKEVRPAPRLTGPVRPQPVPEGNRLRSSVDLEVPPQDRGQKLKEDVPRCRVPARHSWCKWSPKMAAGQERLNWKLVTFSSWAAIFEPAVSLTGLSWSSLF